MKKKQRLLGRLLLPTMLVLLLLPPISCLIFHRAAKQYAYAEAASDLQTLQQNILPLMRNSFAKQNGEGGSEGDNSDADSARPNRAATSDFTGNATASGTTRPHSDNLRPSATPETENAVIAAPTEQAGAAITAQVRTFLSQVGPLVHEMGGDARLMILAGEMQVIYPHEEAEKEAVAPLGAYFAQYIQTEGLADAGLAAEVTASDGETYLLNIYEAPIRSAQIKYLITYCSTSQISAWVHNASLLVLAISSVFVLLTIVVLWMTARSVTRPLHRLCWGADQIGSGCFQEIEPDFSLKELEELRQAMNQMSGQLMRSDEIQKTFFQNVSHELRNPLMSISGYAQGIEQGIFQTPQDAAHTILEESARLTQLVNSLLTLSRMESDRQTTLSFVRIADPIEDGLDRLNGLALQKDVSLVLAPFDHSMTAYGEEDLLSKVLDNLLTNAIRYAKTTVTVSVAAQGDRVLVSVADDGDGIAPKDLPHLFERCYKGKGGKFGIGLAIARSAAQKIEGELTAANQENGGAIFTLSLKGSE